MQLKDEVKKEDEHLANIKKDLKTKQRISSLIPDAPSNIERLKVLLFNPQYIKILILFFYKLKIFVNSYICSNLFLSLI